MKTTEELALEVAREMGDMNPWGITEFATRLLDKIAEQSKPIYEVWNQDDYPSHWEEVDKDEYDRTKNPDDKRIIYLHPPKPESVEPVAWMDREGDIYPMPEIPNWCPPHSFLFAHPPKPDTEELEARKD